MRRGRAVAAAVVAVALALTGCTSSDGVAGGSGDIGYVPGDGAVEEFAPDDRVDAPEFGGETAQGDEWASGDHEGEITVVNFWYASCGPCRVEAPIIHAAVEEFGDDVTFVGVNLRDTAPAAAAFEDTFEVPYPSILDEETGAVQLAFSGTVVPNAVPTTLIIDADGRIAVRISGAIRDESILSTLLSEELERA